MRLYALCLSLDVLAIVTGFWLASLIRGGQGLALNGIPLALGALPFFVSFGLAYGAYSVKCLSDYVESARAALGAFGATSLIIVTFAFLAQVGAVMSRLAFVYSVMITAILILVGRAIIAGLIRWALDSVAERCLLIVDGAPVEGATICEVLDVKDLGLRPDLANPDRVARVGELVDPYDKIYLSVAEEHREAWITALKATGASVELLVSTGDIHGAVGLGRLGDADTLILSLGPLSLSSRVQKRLLDLALTIPALILLAPLLIVVAIAIRLDSKGPALFAQTRIGRSSRPFKIYKFRSMNLAQTDATGSVSASRNDQRVTRVGKFIRATSIDELPQLFNVLLGNMSLVGPRPHATASTAGDQLFWEVSQHYWMRHASKPGITGLAQIRGYRGSTEKREDLEGRLRCDLEYLQNWTFFGDLAILAATVKVIKHDNAY
ncbi:exopolysaccharide biosynthesis polyprenyl glycosylphosphotransferase [Sphingomonas panacisoli]|nr:exopolysaccharide biosynthesis polyprenyl glycosylphosphotransferase [Sphingomonas panacisoli]